MNSYILGRRFILAVKEEGTQREIWKARFIVQGHKDLAKSSIVHEVSVARQYSTAVLLSLAAIFGFQKFSTYVT